MNPISNNKKVVDSLLVGCFGVLVLAVVLFIAAYFASGYYQVVQDREQVVRLLRQSGAGEWADHNLVNFRVEHVFTGSESIYCKLEIPSDQVDTFLAHVSFGPRVPTTLPSPLPDYFQEAWWHPADEPDLKIIDFQPGGGKVRRAVAGSSTTGHVYVAIEGH